MTSKLVNVGDTIITKTFMGKSRYPITRVTKTLAMSKRKTDGFEHKFKRQISHSMAHPYSQWNITEYMVEFGVNHE